MEDAFYFGCVKSSGHYLWDQKLSHVWRNVPADFPMNPDSLDGTLFPAKRRGEPDGHVFLNYVNGWTIATFNDRSVDQRPHSNSNFVIRGHHDWSAMKALIGQRFPTVYKRFTFPLVLVGAASATGGANAVSGLPDGAVPGGQTPKDSGALDVLEQESAA